MDSKTLIVKQLNEAHAMETALVTNLTAHITLTTDKAYRSILERHLRETREQVEAIDARRKALGSNASKVRNPIPFVAGLARDAVGQALVLTKGPLDVIRTPSQAERMLKNAKDEAATEALEIATYDALEATAKAAGDTETAKLARRHREQEERMLADLRETITRLADRTYEAVTGHRAATPKRPAAKRAAAKRAARANSRAKSTA
jgi:ferritin-like metal-binding protein YciE